MAGSVVQIVPSAARTTDPTTVQIEGGRGAHRSATFYADVTAINAGDTWVIKLNWNPTGANDVLLAQSGNITATGLQVITLQAPFTSANRAVPQPDNCVFDNTVDGGAQSITASVWAVYGD